MKTDLLVTGAAGFIGRTLTRILAEAGYKITALDNFRFSNQDQLFDHPSVTWVDGDTRNWQLVCEHAKNKEAIMHLAAPSSFLMHEENDLEACGFTLMGFKTIMEAAKKYKIKKVVWASTSAVYEGNQVPYYEGMHLDPPDSKAGCKLFCEQEARRYSNRFGITCIGLRPFSVYGVGEHTKGGYANVISLFSWAMLNNIKPILWGNGQQTRDYIYVDDAARAFLMALEADIPTQELNLGTGLEHTFNEVVDVIGKAINVKPDPIYVPVPIAIYAERLLADTTRMKTILGFETKISIEEGIQQVIEYSKQLDYKDLANMQRYYEKLLEKP